MGLTGLQIFKLLPNTNCKECGSPTCLAFAMKLAAGKESLDKCPDASDEAQGGARRGVGAADPRRHDRRAATAAVTVGEETVFFRHEKTFVRRPGLLPRARRRARSPAAEIEARARRLGRPPHRARRRGLPGGRCGDRRRAGLAGFLAAGGASSGARHSRWRFLRRRAERRRGGARADQGSASAARAARRRGLAPYVASGRRLALPLVVSGPDLDGLAAAAVGARSRRA